MDQVGVAARFSCPDPACSKVFSQKRNQKQHFQNCHQGIVYSCRDCGRVFRSSGALSNHRKGSRGACEGGADVNAVVAVNDPAVVVHATVPAVVAAKVDAGTQTDLPYSVTELRAMLQAAVDKEQHELVAMLDDVVKYSTFFNKNQKYKQNIEVISPLSKKITQITLF